MAVQEIFNSTAVRSVEEQILNLYHETERKHWCNDENKKAIKSLLEVRRRILNSMFVLDEQNKQLLAEFNEAMKQQLIEMRKRAIDYTIVCISQTWVALLKWKVSASWAMNTQRFILCNPCVPRKCGLFLMAPSMIISFCIVRTE